MNDPLANSITPDASLETPPPIFLWRGAAIVLLGTREGDRFVLARGWLREDRLTDVRRWSFADQLRFSVQVRRLVAETGLDSAQARAQAKRAFDWTLSAT